MSFYVLSFSLQRHTVNNKYELNDSKNKQWISRKMMDKLFEIVSLKYLKTLTGNKLIQTYLHIENI